jgi:RNA polymerase sigma-70 factor (ECF subfamily)
MGLSGCGRLAVPFADEPQPFRADAHEVNPARRLETERGLSERPAERAGLAEPSDESLASSAAGGDERACAQLVRRYLRRALAVATEYCHARADAEDIVQDAFGRMVDSLHTFDDARAFGPWFYTIVRNTARNAASHRRRRQHDSLSGEHPSGSATPLENAERAQLRSSIRSAIASLPARQASCFRLCLVEGLTSVEASAALGISESTVRVHLFQARRALQTLLMDWRD